MKIIESLQRPLQLQHGSLSSESIYPPKNKYRCQNPGLCFCLEMIASSLRDAKITICGAPSDDALLAFRWLADDTPDPAFDPKGWYGSLNWCLHWLGRDAATWRPRWLAEIRESWARDKAVWENMDPADRQAVEMSQRRHRRAIVQGLGGSRVKARLPLRDESRSNVDGGPFPAPAGPRTDSNDATPASARRGGVNDGIRLEGLEAVERPAVDADVLGAGASAATPL